MDPKHALSPRDRIRNLDVIYTSPDTTWSLAEFHWLGIPNQPNLPTHKSVGIRWNGDINNPDDKGNPRSHTHGTWFVLPDAIGRPLAQFVKAYRGVLDAFCKAIPE